MAMKSLHERGKDLGEALFQFILTFNDFCVHVEAMREATNGCINFDLMTGSLYASTQIVNNQILAMLTVFENCAPMNQIVQIPSQAQDKFASEEVSEHEQN